MRISATCLCCRHYRVTYEDVDGAVLRAVSCKRSHPRTYTHPVSCVCAPPPPFHRLSRFDLPNPTCVLPLLLHAPLEALQTSARHLYSDALTLTLPGTSQQPVISYHILGDHTSQEELQLDDRERRHAIRCGGAGSSDTILHVLHPFRTIIFPHHPPPVCPQ